MPTGYPVTSRCTAKYIPLSAPLKCYDESTMHCCDHGDTGAIQGSRQVKESSAECTLAAAAVPACMDVYIGQVAISCLAI